MAGTIPQPSIDFWHKYYAVPVMFGIVAFALLALLGVPRTAQDLMQQLSGLEIITGLILFLLVKTLKPVAADGKPTTEDGLRRENAALVRFAIVCVFVTASILVVGMGMPTARPEDVRTAYWILAMASLMGECWIYVFFRNARLKTIS